jgi:hypothetical protein
MTVTYVVLQELARIFIPVYRVYSVSTDNILMWIRKEYGREQESYEHEILFKNAVTFH